MEASDSDNTFTKVLTTDPETLSKGLNRQQSWLRSEKRKEEPAADKKIQCPSCQGSGLREPSTELVALIPYNDERLRPKRTKTKVTAALLVCALLLAACTYVLLPGKVEIQSTQLRIARANITAPGPATREAGVNGSSIVWQVDVVVRNHNRFLPIKVDSVKILIELDGRDLTTVGNVTILDAVPDIGGSGTVNISRHLLTPSTHKGSAYNDAFLNCRCCRQYVAYSIIWVNVQVTMQYSLDFLGQSYFTDSVFSKNWDSDNCNYFDTIGDKDITCQKFNTCPHVMGSGDVIF